MSRGSNNNDNNFLLLGGEIMKSLIQMADMQYTIYLRFLDLTNGDIAAAEQQTFIFMKALNAGNKKDNSEE